MVIIKNVKIGETNIEVIHDVKLEMYLVLKNDKKFICGTESEALGLVDKWRGELYA